jgi:hypothetical protein
MARGHDADRRDADGPDLIDLVLNAMPDPAAVLNRGGRVTRVSRRLSDLLGIDPGAVIGGTLSGCLGGRAPFPVDVAPGLTRRELAEWDWRGRTFRLSAAALNDGVAVAGLDPDLAVLVVIQDVTELDRLRSEARSVSALAEARIVELERDARLAESLNADEEDGPALTSSSSSSSSVGPDLTRSLRLRDPDLFCELVETYEVILVRGLDRLIYKEEPPSRPLRAMSTRLGLVGAGPRDVVEIHGLALRHQCETQPEGAARALADEGRLMVLELMGYLAGFYRNRASQAQAVH